VEKNKLEEMERKELIKYIELKLYEINNNQELDKNEISNILKDVWDKYVKIKPQESDSRLKKEFFQKGKPIKKNGVLNDLKQLENNNEAFIKNNYYQIKLTLKSIIASLS